MNNKIPDIWPRKKPNLPFDGHGWFSHENAFRDLLKKDMENICEIGSWLGKSTRFMMDMLPKTNFYAIDHWSKDIGDYGNGEPINESNSAGIEKISNLFEQFVSNCWDYRERLYLLRGKSHQVLRDIKKYDIKMDAVYIDASHAYDDVYKDIELSVENWPNARIIGDDYSWESVKSAVHDFALKKNLKVKSYPSMCWTYE